MSLENAGQGASVGQEASGKELIRHYDDLIFNSSDITSTSVEKLAAELSEGLSDQCATFIAEAITELQERLSPKRFAHSISVAKTCVSLGDLYGVDRELCVSAGLIHDWDKCYIGQEVFDRATELGIELGEGFQNMEVLIHAITGAKALQLRFKDIDPRIIQAVERHTSGAVDMSDLDMIVYISDMIEPLRKFERLNSLRELVGKLGLRELFSECYRSTVEHLVERHRYMHPDTAKIWNEYVAYGPFDSGATSATTKQ